VRARDCFGVAWIKFLYVLIIISAARKRRPQPPDLRAQEPASSSGAFHDQKLVRSYNPGPCLDPAPLRR
jgi:hypothetical protein